MLQFEFGEEITAIDICLSHQNEDSITIPEYDRTWDLMTTLEHQTLLLIILFLKM